MTTAATGGSAAGVVVYARVCSHDQRSDLERQVARLAVWATECDLEVGQVVCAVGSGLKANARSCAASCQTLMSG